MENEGGNPNHAFYACVRIALRQLHRLPPTASRVVKFGIAAVKTFMFCVRITWRQYRKSDLVFQDELLAYVFLGQGGICD